MQMHSFRKDGPAGAMSRGFALSLLLAVTVAVAACADGSGTPQTKGSGLAAGAETPDVLATIGNEKITIDDLRGRIGPELDQLEIQYQRSRYRLLDASLQQVLRERVLMAEAQKQGKTLDDLLIAEAGPGGLEPSEVEVATWYSENQSRTGGRTLDEVRPQITEMLRNQRGKEVLTRLEARLNEEKKVSINLQPFRVNLDNTGSPAMGNKNAPVTLVEFADFQCPFCATFAPTLKRLKENFGDQLQIVYRQYPILSLHPNAFKAAEAGMCANDQNKFWEMHDLMYAEKDKLTVRELKEKAGRLGLDQKKFDSCMESGKYVEKVQNDFAEGQKAGVSGTPALFVNGIPVEGGAVAYEVVAAAVENELARVKQ